MSLSPAARAALTATGMALLVAVGIACGGSRPTASAPTVSDPSDDPQPWLAKLEPAASRSEALERLKAIFDKRLAAADGLMDDPAVEGFLSQVEPALIEAYDAPYMTAGGEDVSARDAIVALLAQMESTDAVPIYEEALSDIDEDHVERARTSARALADLCRSKSHQALFIPPPSVRTERWRARCSKSHRSVEALLSALNAVKAARVERGAEAVNTPIEDALTGSILSALGNIALGAPDHPRREEVITALIGLAETPDTVQDLYLNVEAIRFLGRIGDRRAIPVLIRALFMEGRRRPMLLTEIARVALMYIEDRDAVAQALVSAGRMEDDALNQMQRGDDGFDARTIKEQVAISLGELGVPSEAVLSYLMEELQHARVDAFDKIPPSGMAVGHLDPERSKAERRAYAAQALGRLDHEPALDVIIARSRLRPAKSGAVLADRRTDPSEIPGMIDALGAFLRPEKTNDVLVAFLDYDDVAVVDRAAWKLALQAGPELADQLADRAAAFESAGENDPRQEVGERFLSRYVPALRSGRGCINIDCMTSALGDDNAAIRERAAYQLILHARGDGAASDRARSALIDALGRERTDSVIDAIVFAIDRLSPHGAGTLGLQRLDQVMLDLQDRPLLDAARLAITGLRGRLAARSTTP